MSRPKLPPLKFHAIADVPFLLFVVAVIVIVLLAGCQSQPAREVVGSAPVTTVSVPLIGPCVKDTDIPMLPMTSMPPRTGTTDALADGAYADLHRYREIAKTQAELLRACAAASSPTK